MNLLIFSHSKIYGVALALTQFESQTAPQQRGASLQYLFLINTKIYRIKL